MNATEATRLGLLVKGLCPSQPMDEVTLLAWEMILEETDYDAAVVAVKTIYKAPRTGEWSRKIEPDQIIAEVAKRRGEAIGKRDAELDPPAQCADDPEAYVRWLRWARKRLGDGVPVQPAIGAGGGSRSLPAGYTAGRAIVEGLTS